MISALLAAVIVMLGGAGGGGGASLLDESFNNATNYDDGTGANAWTEVVDDGTNDPNETALLPSGTGFSGECYEANATAANDKAYIRNELAAAQGGAVYVVWYLYLETMPTPADASSFGVGGITDTTAVPGSTSPFIMTLIYDADGVSGGETNCGGACWRLNMRSSGGTSRSPQITEDAIHKIKVKVDNGVAGEAWLDSTQYLSADAASVDSRYIWAGVVDFSLGATRLLWDDVTADSTGYVE